MARMQRTQIYLEPELADSLDRLARKRGTSRASLIRLAARQLVADAAPGAEDSIFGIIGMGRGGPGDVAENHDEYLVAAEIESWRR